eukprot:CAMPEP_0119567410 /NCGR_PEP_ID=MMETSP1352-20130426/35838_1 /TAXON_ID=265584 /ORGANISM="Stauroneis constricta, Strain CCMP1120" /LENGTH=69 /DNA_ID=CAMNT_0007616667 /DNA_START=18 /DNA_END=224 /DNA_ORIENTATION=+
MANKRRQASPKSSRTTKKRAPSEPAVTVKKEDVQTEDGLPTVSELYGKCFTQGTGYERRQSMRKWSDQG